MYYVVKENGKALFSFTDKRKCVAEMLVRGMISDIERFGCVWKSGVELIEKEDDNAVPRTPVPTHNGD